MIDTIDKIRQDIIVISLENIEALCIELCIISILNHKTPVVFHKLKSYDSHLVMQEIGEFNPKTSVIPNGLEKHINFTINNKLSFLDSLQFLSSSLDSLDKNLGKNDFKYLSQEFDCNLVK